MPSDKMPLSMTKFSMQILSFRFSNSNCVWSYPISKCSHNLAIISLCIQNYSLPSVLVKTPCTEFIDASSVAGCTTDLWRVLVKVIMNSRPPRRLLESLIEVFHGDFTIYVHLTSLDDNGSFTCRKFDIRKASCANKNANATFPLYYQMSTASHTCLYGLLHSSAT